MRLLVGPYNLGDGKIGEQVDDSLLNLEHQEKVQWDEDRKARLYLVALSSWRGPDEDVQGTERLSSKLAEVMSHDQYGLPEIAAQLKENTCGKDEAVGAKLLEVWIRELIDNPTFVRGDIRTASEIKDEIGKLSATYLPHCNERKGEGKQGKKTLAWTLDILDRHVKRRKDGEGFCFETDGIYLSVSLHLFLSASSMLELMSESEARGEVEGLAWIYLRNYVALVLYTEIKCHICREEDIEDVTKRGAEQRKFMNE